MRDELKSKVRTCRSKPVNWIPGFQIARATWNSLRGNVNCHLRSVGLPSAALILTVGRKRCLSIALIGLLLESRLALSILGYFLC